MTAIRIAIRAWTIHDQEFYEDLVFEPSVVTYLGEDGDGGVVPAGPVMLAAGGRLIVHGCITADDTPAGLIQGGSDETGLFTATIAVDPAQRRKGIGRAAIRELARLIRTTDLDVHVTRLGGEVRRDNVASLALTVGAGANVADSYDPDYVSVSSPVPNRSERP